MAAPAQGPLRRRPRPPAAPRCAPPPSRSCRASLRPHSFLAPTWPPSLPPQRGPPRRREAPTVATPQRWRLPAIERTTAAWCRPAPPRCRRAPRVAQWAPWSTRHCSTRRSTMRPPSRYCSTPVSLSIVLASASGANRFKSLALGTYTSFQKSVCSGETFHVSMPFPQTNTNT